MAIKSLIKADNPPIQIAELLSISKQKVNYWIKNEIRTVQITGKKLNSSYIKKICEFAKDKTMS